jgi:hypothetical protein
MYLKLSALPSPRLSFDTVSMRRRLKTVGLRLLKKL